MLKIIRCAMLEVAVRASLDVIDVLLDGCPQGGVDISEVCDGAVLDERLGVDDVTGQVRRQAGTSVGVQHLYKVGGF